jgi:hypothetical protein
VLGASIIRAMSPDIRCPKDGKINCRSNRHQYLKHERRRKYALHWSTYTIPALFNISRELPSSDKSSFITAPNTSLRKIKEQQI